LLQAISAYNTGSLSRGFQNGYVNNVLSQVGKPVIIPNLRPTKANVGRVSNAEGARGTVRLEFSELEYRGEKTEEVQSVKSTKGTSKRSDAINSSLAIKESQNEDNE
jgi:hypothetical protein